MGLPACLPGSRRSPPICRPSSAVRASSSSSSLPIHLEFPSMRRSLWAMSCLALAMAAHVSAQQFTYNAAALPAQNIWTDGVELADIDADGDIDIMFANGSAYGGAGASG